ncbi:MAG: ribonucleoside-diphosphate reductase subunit alpha [Candidatus Staskawiczbacteria bacterium]|nr:ribonucleoside-diphosphate reductase subunit alpha [Candidatus Staskawiczbacteria bacterium]
MNIYVTKRDGNKESFNADRINRSIERACFGLKDPVSKVVQIATETTLMLYDGITTEELDYATVNAALQNIQEDIAYDKIATRLLLKTVYKRIFGDYDNDKNLLEEKYKKSFIDYIKNGVSDKFLDEKMLLNFNLEKLSDAIDTNRDELFKYAGVSTLLDRYSIKDKFQKPIEPPQYFFMRVAMGLSYNEADPTKWAILFYDKMSNLEYIAGGSTNIGAGTTMPALSNCFLLEIQDSMEHIAKSVSDVIKLSKATGGIGASITKLRASGSPLSSNNTTSSGPTPFAKIIDTAIRAVQRGGKKKGALCFYMENWHLDFPDFLMWKHNAGDDYLRMRTADTAVFMSDEFMKRVENGEPWYMFDPKETPDLNELYGEAFSKRYKEYIQIAELGKLRKFLKIPAEEQYRQILVMLQTTSHPWLTWKDPINVRALNNNTGTIHMSNLCTEICLPQDKDNIAVCNLASINIVEHVENLPAEAGKSINWQKLEQTARLAVRHLDNLIDINILPIPEAARSDKENRAIGLGVMGFSETVEILKLTYENNLAYELIDKIFEFISYMAIDESCNLAKERGSYKHFAGSKWSRGYVPFDTIEELEISRGQKIEIDKTSHSEELGIDWAKLREKIKQGVRNATLMAVAPNANIGLVAGTTPGIDPRFAQVFSRNKISGKYLDINHNLVNELRESNLWEQVRQEIIERQGDISEIEKIPKNIRDRYKSSFEISPYAFIEVAARAQKWVDQSLSRNMYLETRVIEEIMDIYKTAWKKGLKTTYYLHMKPRHTAEQSTVSVNKREQLGKMGFSSVDQEIPSPSPVSPFAIGYQKKLSIPLEPE